MPFSPLDAFLRTLFFYFFLLLMVRLTGKHSIGRLSPFDFVVTIMLAETATMAIEDQEKPVAAGVIPIVTLVALEIALAYLMLKVPWLRAWISDRPTVVIRDGRIDEQALRRLRFSLDDLMEELRLKGVSDVRQVAYALWERSGGFSVVLRPDQQPLRPSDLGVRGTGRGLPIILIEDGHWSRRGLQLVGIDRGRLARRLAAAGIKPGEILMATATRGGEVVIQLKQAAGGGQHRPQLDDDS
ncbi:MAG TPA: DUF421 domain-containing protein [Bacillota bacterium]